ncbi:Ldh family oxidoreductase [Pseudarthrobacter sp. NS4]|uniref:Ldh family oxidoreductase n=1 Tax=Pseudarthrobacter sp. NS4 TaxID=2973976 RepID=UPI0021623F2F|nr:Ldh family oxidoreductase [Pseudarthrobacter sp. NS4]
MTTIPSEELAEICRRALERAGADSSSAEILAKATVEAELVGNRAVGVGHLFDYLDGYGTGRIATDVQPRIHRSAPAVIDVDASNGLAQAAFEAALPDLLGAAREAGIAALWVRRSYTCGELGYYPRRLAQEGFIAMASANSPALMSVGGSPQPVLGTNPLAYAIPRPGKMPFVIDQASSSTAYVNIKRAAEKGEPIPAGWALGPDGKPTQNASEALQGTLLPFGGHRGGNVALLMEVLATLSGANFSVDAAPFDHGAVSPGIGVFLLAIDPARFTGSVDRIGKQLEYLRDEHQVRLPALELTALPDHVEIDDDALLRLRKAAEAA